MNDASKLRAYFLMHVQVLANGVTQPSLLPIEKKRNNAG